MSNYEIVQGVLRAEETSHYVARAVHLVQDRYYFGNSESYEILSSRLSTRGYPVRESDDKHFLSC